MDIKAKRMMRQIAIAIALVLVATLSAHWGVQQTAAFKVAETYVLSAPEVTQLGSPIDERLRLFGYSMRVTDASGSAEFSFDIKGASGKAVVHVRLKKDLGVWSVIDSKVIPT